MGPPPKLRTVAKHASGRRRPIYAQPRAETLSTGLLGRRSQGGHTTLPGALSRGPLRALPAIDPLGALANPLRRRGLTLIVGIVGLEKPGTVNADFLTELLSLSGTLWYLPFSIS